MWSVGWRGAGVGQGTPGRGDRGLAQRGLGEEKWTCWAVGGRGRPPHSRLGAQGRMGELSDGPASHLGDTTRPPDPPGSALGAAPLTCPAGRTSRTGGPGPGGSCCSRGTGGRLPRVRGPPGQAAGYRGGGCRALGLVCSPPRDGPHLLGSQHVDVAAAAVHQQVGADGRARGPHLL